MAGVGVLGSSKGSEGGCFWEWGVVEVAVFWRMGSSRGGGVLENGE